MDNNQSFTEAYWAAQPPEIRALRGQANIDGPAWHALMARGFVIDLQIMVWNWDPWKVMFMRKALGYTRWPAANQPNITEVPGEDNPTVPNYDPTGMLIKVSVDPADYPAFDPPKPPAPPAIAPGSSVGSYLGGGVYASLTGDPANDGEIVTESRGRFVKHKILSFGGNYAAWYTPAA